MKRKFALVLVTLALVPWCGCGGGHGGGSSPTEAKSRLTLGGLLQPVGGAVQEVRLFLDGKEVARQEFGSGCLVGCTATAMVEDVPRGQHTFSLTVTRQVQVNVVYVIVMDGLYVDASGLSTQIPARTSTVSLRAGGMTSYNISF